MNLNIPTRVLVLGALALPTGCVNPKDVGPSPLETAEGTSDGSSGSSTAEESGAPESSTGEPPLECPDNPSFTCSEVIDCNDAHCGAPGSEFDADGCQRVRCGDGTPCPAGRVCVALGGIDSCAPSTSVWVEDENGVCGGGGTADCSPFVSVCVEESVAFPTACGELEDEASCLAAGCSAWIDTASVGTPGCTCESTGGTCVWWEDGMPGADDAPAIYVRGDGVARLFVASWDPPPFGWHTCEESEFGAAECVCDGSEPLCF